MTLMRWTKNSALVLWLLAAGIVPAQELPVLPTPRAEVPVFTPPRYDLDIHLDLECHIAKVRQRVTWINSHATPAQELVFNAHSHYRLPEKDVGFMAKMLEILRMNPGDVLDFSGPACEIKGASLIEPPSPSGVGNGSPPSGFQLTSPAPALPFHYREDNATALVVPLPRPVAHGESVSIAIDFVMHLPQKQGRWGQWMGVTFLSNWQPVLAYYDDEGWHPTPFIPWHQPFFNEAGAYNVRVTLPADQNIACTGSILRVDPLAKGMKQVTIAVSCARDFALLCSARYREFAAQCGPVKVRCMAFVEHEYHARQMVRVASEAIEAYSRWFGPYPYPEFTVAESYFGWNGNECAGLVMIDERIFAMPHLAGGFVDYLISHETCHQWWYNTVGTNGYAETWMDEGLATYFSHRLLNIKYGKNNHMLTLPKGLEWLPNIDRETYRLYGLYGTLGRGEQCATVQDMPQFKHIVSLFSMCYDRGNKIVGMIEDRLGETAFLDFMRHIYRRYYFRILRVADFERELEAYTGRSWQEFFEHWLYSADMTDWCIEKVKIQELARKCDGDARSKTSADTGGPYKVTVLLHQKAEYNEQTVLGFSLDGSTNYQIRIPILPQTPQLTMDNPPARVESLPDNRVRVDVTLPCRPTQIAVDPDQVLVDRDPANNYWKPQIRFRGTFLYTLLDETDITTAYDRWNVTAGPWLYGSAYADPWYARSPMAGFRVGIYRTQEFNGGAYLAYRTDYSDIVAGIDGLWDHWPVPHTQIGFNAERALTAGDDDLHYSRAALFGRYVLQYGDSLYLPPMEYFETFGAVAENPLPPPYQQVPGAERLTHSTTAGVHYHLDYLTPYWYPQGGFRIDATYATGIPIFGEHEPFNEVDGQVSFVKKVPDGLGWLSRTLVAARAFAGIGLPDRTEYFALGGSTLFRGFDVRQRQGNFVWVGSLEWRFPLAEHLTWDCLDHTVGLRNVYGAAFYDVGDAYVLGHALGPVAHALGGGLRFDVAWFSFVERTTLRLDIAKTIDSNAPVQFWFGVGVPF
jgi:hypothetical protein